MRQMLTTAAAECDMTTRIDGADRPHGWALIGVHVDDTMRMMTSKRIGDYIQGGVAVKYAMKIGPFAKFVGFTYDIDLQSRTVTKHCLDYLKRLHDLHCSDLSCEAKHIMRTDVATIPKGVRLDASDVEFAGQERVHKSGLSLIMALNWAVQAYPAAVFPVMCYTRHSQLVSQQVYTHAKHTLNNMIKKHRPKRYGGLGCRDLEEPDGVATVPPVIGRDKYWHFHGFADASPGIPSITSVMFFLAGAPIVDVGNSQHVQANDATTAEIVAAGTAMALGTPVRELLHAIGVKQLLPTSLYLDSSSTCFVINDNGAVKNSLWMARRIVVMQDQKRNGVFDPKKVSEKHNVSDKNTKYTDVERLAFLLRSATNEPYVMDGDTEQA